MKTKSEVYWEQFWKTQKNTIYNKEVNSWYDFVMKSNHETIYKIIKQNYNNLDSLKFIEVGCGSAKFTQFMINNVSGDFTISDHNENILNQSKKKIREMYNKNINIQKLDLSATSSFENKFDIVYSGGVLEFFEDIEKPISNMSKLTNKDGICLAIVIPRKFSLQTIANIQKSVVYFFRSLIKGQNFGNGFFYSHLDKNTFINSYSSNRYKKVFIDNGFKKVNIYSLVPFPSFALGKKLDKKYAKFLDKYASSYVNKFNRSDIFINRLIGSSILIYAKKN